MGWFDEQLRQRKQQDDDLFAEAFDTTANAVLGHRFSFEDEDSSGAFTYIINYFHFRNIKFPDDISTAEARLDYLCRYTGLMHRPVKLEKGWYKDSFGPYIARLRESGELVALMPGGYQRYTYYDPEQHKHIRVTRKNEDVFEDEALCFYKPLPLKKLSTADLIKYAVSSCSISDIVLVAVMLGVSTLVGLLLPKLNYFLFDNVVEGNSYSLLLSTLLFLICVSLANIIFQSVSTMFSSRITTKLSNSVESATMMRILALPTSFFKKYSSGEITQRMQYVSSLCESVINVVFTSGLTGVFSLAYISQIFAYAPGLVVPSLIVIVAEVLFSVITTLKQIKISTRRMELSAKNNGISLSMISGVQKIKLSGSEKRLFSRWAQSFSDETRISYNPPLFIKINSTISLLITCIGQFFMYFFAVKTNVGVAEYYAFQTAYAMVAGAISSLSVVALTGADLKPYIEMSKPILEAVPELSEKAQTVKRLSGAIELNKVCFKYDESMPNVIDDFSLKIRPGQYVAIVGKTGCGKSTLIRLILGFEKPQKGAIYFDGRDLNTLDKRSLRRTIGTVMQDDKLFMGDIFSNIVICAPNLTLDDAWAAAEKAGIADDIRSMPMGMNTFITDGGGSISGGQRQRLVIARAIAPKPSILIFDEATSALDNITQKMVSESLDELKCTRIVIAHRLSTIRHCDRILVMDKGHIIEDGTYEELIAAGGYFAELVERQRIDTKTGG